MSALANLTDELDQICPRFDISADQIKILQSPASFYETLKIKILNAKHHVFLSTLYIGKNEHELVDVIRQSLTRHPGLTVSILTDYLRGNRETPSASCATLLLPLVREFPDRVKVRMYHTPNLTGLRKRLLPKRINEGWGLQHMKIYGFDDEVMLSGANLSDDYFTNRQDRYHVFASREIKDYYLSLFNAISSLSFRLIPADNASGGLELQWPASHHAPSPLQDPAKFIDTATSTLKPILKSSTTNPADQRSDTQVYPISQFTPLLRPDSSTELPVLRHILQALAQPALANSSWTFTAGYFNMTPEMRQLLLATNPTRGTVVAASPWANGFYRSKGISGLLPAAYTHLSRKFLSAIGDAGLSSRISLKEWRLGTVNEPGGWSYHAKGLWVTLPHDNMPSMTVVGSSNYTKRSYTLDLESNALIVTRNKDLMQRLAQEESWLQKHAKMVDEHEYEKTERRVGIHVRIAMWLVTALIGAL